MINIFYHYELNDRIIVKFSSIKLLRHKSKILFHLSEFTKPSSEMDISTMLERDSGFRSSSEFQRICYILSGIIDSIPIYIRYAGSTFVREDIYIKL